MLASLYDADDHGNGNGNFRVLAAVLAAGGSTRMGCCKLTRRFADSTLVENAVGNLGRTSADKVLVVTGAYADEIEFCLRESAYQVECLCNQRWMDGQGTSVSTAARYAIENGYQAMLVLVADQPFVDTDHLEKLISVAREQLAADGTRGRFAMVSSIRSANHRQGNPCVFGCGCFEELLGLEGDEGARSLLRKEDRPKVVPVEFPIPDIFMDADTPQAFELLEEEYLTREPVADEDDFPLLGNHRRARGRFSYLDSAATSCVARCVEDAIVEFEECSRANIHRGIYELSEDATECYEAARDEVAEFFNVLSNEVIFTHGATEALNIAAFGWAASNLKQGDLVLVDTCNHHSNIVPWQMLEKTLGIELRYIGCDESGLPDKARFESLLAEKPKAVALSHVSNVTGLMCDAAELIGLAHDAGAAVVLDCAQSAGHTKVDLTQFDVDFACVSAHKMHGPFGIGMLYAKQSHQMEMVPVYGGGGMIRKVDESGFIPAESPMCFEAGTPNITGAIGFARACRYLTELGVERIEKHGRYLTDRMISVLRDMPGVRIMGSECSGLRTSMVSFSIDGVHPHDAAEYFGNQGICVRAGQHCAMPLHAALGERASIRASFAAHTRAGEIDRLLQCIEGLR